MFAVFGARRMSTLIAAASTATVTLYSVPNLALANSDDQLAEVVVTAEKRSERLQDVPVPVTSLGGDNLADNNQLRIQDYFASVPGLNFTTDDRGTPNLAIRGVSTGAGAGNPTVGITIDDVPYGSSSTYGGGYAPVPDIDPSDLARVEVLRGPQGTLYGASSIGGLLSYVTVDPSTAGYSGRLEAGTNHVYNGAEPGYNMRGSVNIPLSDTLAIRASAFTRQDAGYVDNVVTGQEGVNRAEVYGGHLSALWRPSEVWSLKLSALYQNTRGYGSPGADPSLGDLRQNDLPGTGGFYEQSQAYSATLKVKLGGADLTVLSGYNAFALSDTLDFTPLLGANIDPTLGVTGVRNLDYIKTKKFSQEIRLALPLGPRLDWLLGAFYTYEDSHVGEQWFLESPTTGQLLENALISAWPSTYAEYAAFTDLTWHLTDRFDIQFGGRESQNKQTYSEVDGGGYGPLFLGVPGPVVTPEVATKDNAFTYLVTPRLKLSSDLMIYARLASGYRPGGPNATCVPLNVPCHFKPDTTRNYEVGVKGDGLDRRVSFDASVYYIDWRDIQLQVLGPNNAGVYYTNAGRATSKGVELSSEVLPLTGMTVSGWVAWNDAVLAAPFPPGPVVGADGDRLPNSSRLSGNVSLEQSFPLSTGVTGFVRGTAAYVGDRLGIFLPTAQRQEYPAYAQFDLRTGVRYDTWAFSLFATNITDRRGVLGGGLGAFTPGFTYIQPRTLGLTVAKTS